MVEADGSDDRNAGGSDVGGVEAAAHPDFEDRDLDSPIGEREEGRRRHRFEIRRGRGIESPLHEDAPPPRHPGNDSGEFFGRNGTSLDVDALLEKRRWGDV